MANSEFPARKANAVHVWHMCNALAQNGHECQLMARRQGDFQPGALSFRLQLMGSRQFVPLNFPFWVLRRSASLGAPDLFYGRHLPALLCLSFNNVPFVYESHAMTSGVACWLEGLLLRRPNLKRVILISDALRRDFRARYPWVPSDKILVLHDAANTPDGSKTTNRSISWPGRPEVPQVGYVGSLYPGKGYEMLLRLAAQMPQVDFHIVGGGREALNGLVGTAIPTNLHFHGFVPHEELAAYYARFQLALLPLQQRVLDQSGRDIGRWTSPLKLFEYMANELPVVASKLPVLEEILTDGQNALLVDPQDQLGWEKAVERLLTDENFSRKLSTNARKLLEGDYTWKLRAEKAIEGIHF